MMTMMGKNNFSNIREGTGNILQNCLFLSFGILWSSFFFFFFFFSISLLCIFGRSTAIAALDYCGRLIITVPLYGTSRSVIVINHPLATQSQKKFKKTF